MTEDDFDIPQPYDDRPDEEIVFTRNFGVCRGLGLMMIKLDEGKENISLTANNADVLKEIKRLLIQLKETDYEVSDMKLNGEGYPEFRVATE